MHQSASVGREEEGVAAKVWLVKAFRLYTLLLHHVASSLFPLFVSMMFYIFYLFFVATVTPQESVSDQSANPQTYMWRYL